MSSYNYVGKSVPKIDGKERVTGRALYAADIVLPRMLYGKIVRCWEYAHARVKKIDVSEAEKLPGVVKIVTPEQVTSKPYNVSVLDLMVSEESGRALGDIEDQQIFTTHVKHQGDGICGVIARSEEAAEEAAKKIKVEYEPLPVYLKPADAAKAGAVQFSPLKPGNLAFQLPESMFPDNAYGYGDVDAAMKAADVIAEDTFHVPKQKQCQMETHSFIALLDDQGRLECWTSTQMPKLVQAKLARLFELPMSRMKVTQTSTGGAFGARLGMVAEPETCAMALAVPGHPVKVSYLREEDWAASVSRHPGSYWMKIGFKKSGEPIALDARFTAEKGGYYVDASGVPFTTGAWLQGMYKWGSFRYRGEAYFTNHGPCGAFRGYGNPQTQFAMEQLVDRGCAQLGIDPVEWRIKWHKDVGDDGWVIGVKYVSCALTECLERGAEEIGWKEKRRKYQKQTGIKRRGVGVGVMTHCSGAMPMLLELTSCSVKVNEDATAEVLIASSDLGTGAHTALLLIAAETLDFPLEDIHMKVRDSDAAGFDIGAHASRTCYVGGGAVLAACNEVKKQILERAGQIFKVDPKDLEYGNKKVWVKNEPQRSLDLKDMIYRSVVNFPDPATGKRDVPPGQILGYVSYYPPHNSPPFAACFAEVEVDTETGEVKVLEVVQAYDIGQAIHPASVEGQLEGGIQQGLGFVLCEDMQYDAQGHCLTNNFTDYKLLGPADMPKSKIVLVERPDPMGPYGAKSCGESGLITPIGAVANAVYNALGIQFTEAPITPERVLAALRKTKAE